VAVAVVQVVREAVAVEVEVDLLRLDQQQFLLDKQLH
jgi:hypothetical protein